MIIKSLMAIPKYQVGETYKKGKKLFQIVRVEPINNKVFVYEIIDGYINPKEDYTFTEQEMETFKKVERDKGRVIGNLRLVEHGGHNLHLIEIQEGENYDQMYFTERQFQFIEKLTNHINKLHELKNILNNNRSK